MSPTKAKRARRGGGFFERVDPLTSLMLVFPLFLVYEVGILLVPSAFNGAEANLRTNLWCNCNWYVDGFLGFRYLALTESLNVSENLTVLAPLTITVASPSGPIARSVPLER